MYKLMTVLALYVFPGLAGLTLISDGYWVIAESPVRPGYVITTLASAIILGCHAKPSTSYNSDANTTALWMVAGFVLAVATVATHPLLSFATATSALFAVLMAISISDLFHR